MSKRKSKRPSLGQVMELPAVIPTFADAQPTSARRIGKRSQGWVQLNVLVPKELRQQAKVKALMEERELSEVVAELLRQWVE